MYNFLLINNNKYNLCIYSSTVDVLSFVAHVKLKACGLQVAHQDILCGPLQKSMILK